ncbi:cytochrome c oxidase assembly protein [Acrocarpospora catenulata]|uniref:cytochrome c oxidase assembly protein n=1 Tax=Acrocarpospora catenulata TaxID=2836182 RepID=UPI002023A13D|nr:cytochrome c oxidase assembly protein [Acrocarpospora catenulata]
MTGPFLTGPFLTGPILAGHDPMIGHDHHQQAGAEHDWAPLAVLAILACAYLWLAARRRAEPRGWNTWRTASFTGGLALLATALTGPVSTLATTDFRGHMLQHLLTGMLAPLALVLGTPLTLLLRSLPATHARRLTRLLRSRACHLAANPWTALTLSVGGMAALYCTPLYRYTSAIPATHHLVHAHFLLSGYLFAWAIAGADPAPRRPSVPARLTVLGVAIAAHATLAQLMYAGLAVDVPAPADQLRGAAELMYYGGDIAELLLALALITTWRPAHRRDHHAGQRTLGSVNDEPRPP